MDFGGEPLQIERDAAERMHTIRPREYVLGQVAALAAFPNPGGGGALAMERLLPKYRADIILGNVARVAVSD